MLAWTAVGIGAEAASGPKIRRGSAVAPHIPMADAREAIIVTMTVTELPRICPAPTKGSERRAWRAVLANLEDVQSFARNYASELGGDAAVIEVRALHLREAGLAVARAWKAKDFSRTRVDVANAAFEEASGSIGRAMHRLLPLVQAQMGSVTAAAERRAMEAFEAEGCR
jgi:hypothetical protein